MALRNIKIKWIYNKLHKKELLAEAVADRGLGITCLKLVLLGRTILEANLSRGSKFVKKLWPRIVGKNNKNKKTVETLELFLLNDKKKKYIV